MPPSIASTKYVLDTFVGTELARLRSPECDFRSSVHVLQLTVFAGTLAQSRKAWQEVSAVHGGLAALYIRPVSSPSTGSPAMIPAIPPKTCAFLNDGLYPVNGCAL